MATRVQDREVGPRPPRSAVVVAIVVVLAWFVLAFFLGGGRVGPADVVFGALLAACAWWALRRLARRDG